MKIGFVFQKDSHYKAVQATATRILEQYPNAQGRFFALSADDEQSCRHTALVDLDTLHTMQDCQYLICCLGGYLLNKVIRAYHDTDTRVIALFPGIVSHYQLDAFISRFHADQVWLNCPADYELYARLCTVFGVKNNGILYGSAWFADMSQCPTDSKGEGGTIFFEQTQIIHDAKTAQQIELQLCETIQKNPNKPFVYKLRQNIHNEYLSKMRERISRFANVQMVSVLSDGDMQRADTFLSISSSAVIEGLLLGKQSVLLNKCYLDEDALEFFGGSRLFLNNTPDSGWLKSRVTRPASRVMLASIAKQSVCQFDKRNHWAIVLKIICLAWYFPKLLKLLGKQHKIKAIQKSLEYVRIYDKSEIRD